MWLSMTGHFLRDMYVVERDRRGRASRIGVGDRVSAGIRD